VQRGARAGAARRSRRCLAQRDADRTSGFDDAGRRELDALTRHTGGVAYYPAAPDALDAAVAELARQQYTIAYAPTNQALDGTYRRIRVEARGAEPLVVRTRAGYVAASATQQGRSPR